MIGDNKIQFREPAKNVGLLMEVNGIFADDNCTYTLIGTTFNVHFL